MKQTRQPRLTEPGERMKRVLVQSTDNQRGQDGLIPWLYVHAPTQTAFVTITGSFSVEKPKQEASIVIVLL